MGTFIIIIVIIIKCHFDLFLGARITYRILKFCTMMFSKLL